MSFSEFLTLMRLYRETELRYARASYSMYCGRRSEGLALVNLQLALEKLKLAPPQGMLESFQKQVLGDAKTVSFDDFIVLTDKCRSSNVIELRKQASFTREEFEQIQKHFKQHRKSGNEYL